MFSRLDVGRRRRRTSRPVILNDGMQLLRHVHETQEGVLVVRQWTARRRQHVRNVRVDATDTREKFVLHGQLRRTHRTDEVGQPIEIFEATKVGILHVVDRVARSGRYRCPRRTGADRRNIDDFDRCRRIDFGRCGRRRRRLVRIVIANVTAPTGRIGERGRTDVAHVRSVARVRHQMPL